VNADPYMYLEPEPTLRSRTDPRDLVHNFDPSRHNAACVILVGDGMTKYGQQSSLFIEPTCPSKRSTICDACSR